MGLFPSSYSNQYILLAMDYVCKWVEAIAIQTNDDKIVASFIKKNNFSSFGTPRAIISDGGSHFFKNLFMSLFAKYKFKDRKALAYHPQPNGLAKVSTREIKRILQKMVSTSRKD